LGWLLVNLTRVLPACVWCGVIRFVELPVNILDDLLNRIQTSVCKSAVESTQIPAREDDAASWEQHFYIFGSLYTETMFAIEKHQEAVSGDSPIKSAMVEFGTILHPGLTRKSQPEFAPWLGNPREELLEAAQKVFFECGEFVNQDFVDSVMTPELEADR